jgi:protein ImuA
MSALFESPTPLAPEQLHPALWRAHQLGQQREPTLATGFSALDAELPGGGWPVRMLTELLLAHAGLGEMRLLAPVLARLAQAGRCVMLFGAPAALSGAALAQWGVDGTQCLLVQANTGTSSSSGPCAADTLWALEQALKSGQLGAVLAWPGAHVRPQALRRLQMAAQGHDGPAFLFRPTDARHRPSPAPLRLLLRPAGWDELAVQIFKRRGPALAQPLHLALQPVLSARARRRALALITSPGPAYAGSWQSAADPCLSGHGSGR